MSGRWAFIVLLVLGGCSDPADGEGAGTHDDAVTEADTSGGEADAGVWVDVSPLPTDTASTPDAGPVADAGAELSDTPGSADTLDPGAPDAVTPPDSTSPPDLEPEVDAEAAEDTAPPDTHTEPDTPITRAPCDPAECVDGNPCTNDLCHPELGCVFQPHSDPCDDGDACTADDTCSFASCVGQPVSCDDDDECTLEACDHDLGCVYEIAPECIEPCGDGLCDNDESCTSCPEDCGGCGEDVVCCDPLASAGCGHPGCEAAVCGDDPHCCLVQWDFHCANVATDVCPGCAPPGPFCGDGSCDPDEDCDSCEPDCGECPPPPVCGDEVCASGETCSSCEADCGECPPDPFCGDGVCSGEDTCLNCEEDCGECPPIDHCCKSIDQAGCPINAACNEAVCELDPYCCDANWDDACGNCAKSEEGYDGIDCSAVADKCECP